MPKPVGGLSIRLKKPDRDSRIFIFWCMDQIILTLARFVMASVGITTGIFRELTLWGIAALPLFYYFLSLNRERQRRTRAFWILFAAVGLLWTATAIFNPEVREFLFRDSYGPERIFRVDAPLFAFLFFLIPQDPKKLYKCIVFYAYMFFAYEMVFHLIPALSRGYWINVSSGGGEIRLPYSLSFGYAMCFPTVVFLYASIKDRKLLHFIMVAAGLICILTNGNRGALLIPVIFVAVTIVSGIAHDQNAKKKMQKIAAILLGLLLLSILWVRLPMILTSVVGKTGISSRTVEMLLQGNFAEDNGREFIWLAVLRGIKECFPLGYGFYGDRPIVFPIHYVGYSHNLFLELLVSFGILGAVIIVLIIRDAVYMIFRCKDAEWRGLYIVFFAISCQLLLSLSFWYVWEFFAATAIVCNYRYKKRHEVNAYPRLT